jgi:hypothetical protein
VQPSDLMILGWLLNRAHGVYPAPATWQTAVAV